MGILGAFEAAGVGLAGREDDAGVVDVVDPVAGAFATGAAAGGVVVAGAVAVGAAAAAAGGAG